MYVCMYVLFICIPVLYVCYICVIGIFMCVCIHACTYTHVSDILQFRITTCYNIVFVYIYTYTQTYIYIYIGICAFIFWDIYLS